MGRLLHCLGAHLLGGVWCGCLLGWGVGAGVLRACFAVLLIGACSACSAFAVAVHRGVAVSYTHLTLPTIYSV